MTCTAVHVTPNPSHVLSGTSAAVFYDIQRPNGGGLEVIEDENLLLTPKCMSRSMLARTSRDVPSQMHASELLVLMH